MGAGPPAASRTLCSCGEHGARLPHGSAIHPPLSRVLRCRARRNAASQRCPGSLLRRGQFPGSGSPPCAPTPRTCWLSLLPAFTGAGRHPDRWGSVIRQVLHPTGTSVSAPHSRSSESRGRMRSTAVLGDISALERDGEPGINPVRLHARWRTGTTKPLGEAQKGGDSDPFPGVGWLRRHSLGSSGCSAAPWETSPLLFPWAFSLTEPGAGFSPRFCSGAAEVICSPAFSSFCSLCQPRAEGAEPRGGLLLDIRGAQEVKPQPPAGTSLRG